MVKIDVFKLHLLFSLKLCYSCIEIKRSRMKFLNGMQRQNTDIQHLDVTFCIAYLQIIKISYIDLSKTLPPKSFDTSSNMIRDPLTQIRVKHGSLTISSAQNEIKLKICNAINQLNDMDSRSVGLSILQSIINNIPGKLLHLVIEPFYAVNNELKALCRKEIALLIGYIGSNRGCTLSFFKYLHKLIANLSKRAQDSDSRVREACADSFGRITKQCIRFSQLSSNDKDSNEVIHKMMKPIMKSIQKCISPNSITGNFLCLSNVVMAADSHLNITHIVVICKCIISNIINVRDSKTHCSLLQCVEKLMTCSAALISSTSKSNKNPLKKVQNADDTDYFSALLAIIIDGLSNNDWNVRNGALKAIHSVGVVFASIPDKPEIDQNRDEIIAHLQRLKYDKISNVRSTAIIALAVWSDIDQMSDIKESMHDLNISGNNQENDDEDIDDLQTNEFTEKPWFDKPSEHDIKLKDDVNAKKEEKECVDDNGNSLILQQQQLMFKTIKNLESFIHREVGSIKSRIHSVERDMQRFKVMQQNNEWSKDNKRANRHQSRPKTAHNFVSSSHPHSISTALGYDPSNPKTESRQSTEMKENENVTLGDSETMSIYSDETQIINLNEQLLNIIQLDNNTELIQWLVQNDNYPLFECIDERLMISLIYRITQLLKNKKYVNDIGSFLKKEFVIRSETIPKDFTLPDQLKTEFLNSINEHENLQPFAVQIADAVQ